MYGVAKGGKDGVHLNGVWRSRRRTAGDGEREVVLRDLARATHMCTCRTSV